MPGLRIRILTWALGALILLALILGFAFRVRRDMHDFEVNYRAGQRLRRAESLYRVDDGHYMFKYLPASALLYAPLTLLPLEAAKGLWYVLILAGSAGMVLLTYRRLPRSAPKPWLVWVVSTLVLLKYFFREWDLGQINALVALVLLGMIAFLIRTERPGPPTHEAGAGALWGLAVALKPYAVVFFPYLLLKRRWISAGAGVLSILAALAAPAVYFGWSGNLTVLREWYTTLSRSTPALLATQDNISVTAFFLKWTGSRALAFPPAALIIVAMALSILAAMLVGKRRPGTTFLEGALLLLSIPLVSPLGWDYTLIMGLPAVMVVVQHRGFYPLIWRILLAANLLMVSVTFFDLMGPGLYATYLDWSVPTLSFLLIFGYAVFLRVRRIC